MRDDLVLSLNTNLDQHKLLHSCVTPEIQHLNYLPNSMRYRTVLSESKHLEGDFLNIADVYRCVLRRRGQFLPNYIAWYVWFDGGLMGPLRDFDWPPRFNGGGWQTKRVSHP